MTVKELIDLLLEQPQDKQVWLDIDEGYYIDDVVYNGEVVLLKTVDA